MIAKDPFLSLCKIIVGSHCIISGLAFVTLLLLITTCGNNASPKFRQYYVHGEKLYLKHCSNCHQKDGTGLGRVYPPLNQSDFMERNFGEVVCLIRHGASGEMIVNGKEYNQRMPAMPALTDLEIAEITTYIYNTWSHDKGIVEVNTVSEMLSACEK